MAKNRTTRDPLPETFATLEEIAEFWDRHDITEYDEYLIPVEIQVAAHPRHEYVIALSDTLDVVLRKVQQREGVPLNTLINLWVQEKLQQYAETLSE